MPLKLLFVVMISLMAFAPQAQAEIKPAVERPDKCFKATPVSTSQKASLTLHPRDLKSLKLARSFENHLRDKGKDPSIIQSLYKASINTGIDFELLLLKAIMESDLGRATIAAKSTARGVFQYIESTWLILMARHGAALGYPHYQDAIKIGRKTGKPYMSADDAFLRTEILALRHDPEVSALMKAYQVMDETETIREYKGGKVTSTDHYIAHMLGLGLSREFYDLLNRDSIFAVARLGKPAMREAARLNRVFFYDKNRNALTAPDVYKRFEARVKRELNTINVVSRTPFKEPCSKIRNVSFQ